jgi:DNA-binding MarR family transcriptional regulator
MDRAVRAFEDFVRAELARHRIDGLTPQQALFLLALEGRPRRLVDVVRIQRIVASNATYLVKSLVQSGFLDRYPDPDDRRTAIVAPTAKGLAAVDALQAALTPSPTALPQVRNAAAAARLLETACSTEPGPPVEEIASEPVARRPIPPPRIVVQPPVRLLGGRGR